MASITPPSIRPRLVEHPVRAVLLGLLAAVLLTAIGLLSPNTAGAASPAPAPLANWSPTTGLPQQDVSFVTSSGRS